MHLADGILDDPTLLIGGSLLGAAAIATALTKVRRCRRGAAWTGALAAFVLAAQAVNVPLVPGASAHVIGAALMTMTVGPARAIVGMFAVLLVQALLFADGGVTTLFINTLNMAVLPVMTTHWLRRLLGHGRFRLVLTAFLGTTLGNLAGAVSLSSLLVWGAGAPFAFTFGWIVGIQTLAGIAEGLLTAGSVSYLARRAPALVTPLVQGGPRSLDERVTQERRAFSGLGLALAAIGLAVLLAPISSRVPDALNVVLKHWGPVP